jgi:very-short-patch-repair endonuclease
VQQLPDGAVVVISGSIVSVTRAEGPRPATAIVKDSTYGEVRTVWWKPLVPSPEGSTVTIQGKVSYYKGQGQVTVEGTQKSIPASEHGRIVAYLRDCTEAEARADLAYSENRQSFLLLPGPSIDIDNPSGIELPRSPGAMKWIAQRRHALTETLLIGIVLVRDQSAQTPTWVPLFTAEIALQDSPETPLASAFSSSLDINPSALKAIDVADPEIDVILNALRSDPEIEEATSGWSRLNRSLEILRSVGVITDTEMQAISLSSLSTPSPTRRISNSAVLIASSGVAAYTAKMQQELTEIAESNPTFNSGPLSVLFGNAPANPVPLPEAFPILVPTSLRQDQAISSAMSNPLTVITGPPGTGKSQVLVNLVNACLSKGETVLFASRNNQAVDVVFNRIEAISPESGVLRAGSANMRSGLAASIQRVLNAAATATADGLDQTRQTRTTEEIADIYDRLQGFHETEQELARTRSAVAKLRDHIPGSLDKSSDIAQIERSIDATADALLELRKPLPSFRRWKRATFFDQRVESLDVSVEDLERQLKISDDGVLKSEIVSLRSIEQSAPWRRQAAKDARGLTLLKTRIRELSELQIQIKSLEQTVSTFDISAIENEVQRLNPERIEIGRLSAALALKSRMQAHPEAVVSAKTLLGHISTAAEGGSGALASRNELPKALPVLPAWGVTNLSVGVTFPLTPELFDLVIIDEASQCDLASAIPLLYRAKRAVIIGDPRQLTHITSIGPAREQLIADRYKLDEVQKVAFSYRAQSLYLAAERVFGEPIFLNLHFRSHPAIIQFSNRFIYNERLEICTGTSSSDGESIRWIDTSGDCSRPQGRGSWFNATEAAAVVEVVRELVSKGSADLGVVTPYRAQTEKIISILRNEPELSSLAIPVATAHKYQGDEADHIIFSPVVGPSMPPANLRFASDSNLLNVALTRARRTLTIVGNRKSCQSTGGLLASLADYVTSLGDSVFDSPLELQLHDALLDSGIESLPGHQVGGYRCDLAIMSGNKLIDIECDGQAFHLDVARDEARDAALKAMGWDVIRFSGRDISRNTAQCVRRVRHALE